MNPKRKERHLGIVQIDSERIVDEWLDFKGGRILEVRTNVYMNRIEFIIEHKDMPVPNDGEMLQVVNPVYRVTKRKQWKFKRVKGKIES